jgi:predicted PurR-regulated permease PerM
MNESSLENKAFLLLLIVVSIAFAWLLMPFYGAIFWAVALAVVFAPLQRRLARRIGGRGSLSSLLTLGICLLLVILPVIVIAALLVQEGAEIYARLESGDLNVGVYVEQLRNLLPTFMQHQLDRLGLGDFAGLRERVVSAAMQGSQFLATKAFSIGQGTFNFLVSLCIMLYLLFFFLRDGPELVRHVRHIIPLGDTQKRRLQIKFTRVVRATIKGNLVVAIVQGALGGLIFWVLGLSNPLLWGVVMAFLSLLPAAGSALIWVPAAIYLLLDGALWQGIVLVLFGVLVIGLVDNVLRPILVGKDTKMPDYVVLISTLGGLVLFGLNGFVIGPVIAALFMAVWDLFGARKQTIQLP